MSSFYGNGISKEVMDKEIQESWRYLGCNWRICR